MSAPILTPPEAEASGLRPLTMPYSKVELCFAERVLADLKRGGIPAALVRVHSGIEVWRTSEGWLGRDEEPLKS